MGNVQNADLMATSGQSIGVFIYDLEAPGRVRRFLREQENYFHSDSLVGKQISPIPGRVRKQDSVP